MLSSAYNQIRGIAYNTTLHSSYSNYKSIAAKATTTSVISANSVSEDIVIIFKWCEEDLVQFIADENEIYIF